MRDDEVTTKTSEAKICAACGKEYAGEYCKCQAIEAAAEAEKSTGFGMLGVFIIIVGIIAAIALWSTQGIAAAVMLGIGGIIAGVLFIALSKIIILLEKIAEKK